MEWTLAVLFSFHHFPSACVITWHVSLWEACRACTVPYDLPTCCSTAGHGQKAYSWVRDSTSLVEVRLWKENVGGAVEYRDTSGDTGSESSLGKWLSSYKTKNLWVPKYCTEMHEQLPYIITLVVPEGRAGRKPPADPFQFKVNKKFLIIRPFQ